MSADWQDKLSRGGVLVTDGGTGSELRRRGVPLSTAAWSGLAALTHPDTLTRIHADYIAAGAEVITTNTFGTTRFVLEAAGAGDRFDDINHAAVDAAFRARDAAAENVAIAASLSCLPPNFDPGAYPDTARELSAYRELAELFAARGVDLIALEMMQDAEHAALACRAARETGLPFWLGVSLRWSAALDDWVGFDRGESRLAEWLGPLLDFGPSAVELMHTAAAEIGPALGRLRSVWPGIVGACPVIAENDGDGPQWAGRYDPAALADLADAWIAAGARIVGGCCGTTPAHIRAVHRAVAGRLAGI